MNTNLTTTEQFDTVEVFNTRYASESLQSIPLGYWIDKTVGGCGLTYLALTDSTDCIILMPRVRLVDDKLNQSDKYKNIFGIKAGVTEREVTEYINRCRTQNQPIKIVTTYDSFALGKIDYILNDNSLAILVDESQYIPEMTARNLQLSKELHKRLEANIERVTFFSAAPPKRQYLQEYIQKMPSIKYVWTKQIQVTPYIYDTKRAYSAVAKILSKLLTEGEFEIEEGVKFKKAIVFVNSVSAIAEIAEKLNQPYNVGYITGDTVRNSMKLGEFATEVKDGADLPIVTLGTSSMLAGIDLYDSETFNIIISTTNKDWTLFDIELDIPQAIARQRLDSNPHNDKFLLVYSKDDYESRINNLQRTYESDIKKIDLAVDNLNTLLENNKEISDAFSKYEMHYTIENNRAKADYSLLNLNKYKFEQLYEQYRNGFTIMTNKSKLKTLKIADIKLSKSYEDYASEIKDCKNNSEMIIILDSIKNSEWKNILTYGVKTKKILTNYTEAKAHYNTRVDYDTVKTHIQNTFKIGVFYSKAEIKSKLKFIYESKSIKKTAKATDLNEFCDTSTRMITIEGKRTEGFEIVRYK